jgi:peptide deformylase
MILKIRQAGELLLREKSRPLSLDEIQSRYIQDLIESMRETMRDAPGVGLAAPQVGILLQVIVIEDPLEFIQKLAPKEAEERQRTPVPFQVLINPRLTRFDGDDVEFFEGCLSLSGYTAIVPRARRVRVDGLNASGEPVVIEASGWYARILQHEVDHLNGTLYVDRMLTRSLATQENYVRFWKDKTIAEALMSLSEPEANR